MSLAREAAGSPTRNSVRIYSAARGEILVYLTQRLPDLSGHSNDSYFIAISNSRACVGHGQWLPLECCRLPTDRPTGRESDERGNGESHA